MSTHLLATCHVYIRSQNKFLVVRMSIVCKATRLCKSVSMKRLSVGNITTDGKCRTFR